MKIEFRKVPNNEKDFEIDLNSVKFLGTFSKISNKLVIINSRIVGKHTVLCCKCGNEIEILLDEAQVFKVSDGIFSSDEEENGEIIIECDNHIIDFEDILNSELESINSDYHICSICNTNDNFVDIEI